MTSEKKSSSKKLLKILSVLTIGFVIGWITHGIQSLYTCNYYIVMTHKETGEQYAIPLYGSGWSKNP